MTTQSQLLQEEPPIQSSDRVLAARQRLMVIIGLFGLTILFAIRAANMWDPTEILTDPLFLLIPAGIGTLVLLRWPQLGLVGMVVAALAIPFEVGTGTGTAINAAILLLGGLLGLWIFKTIAQKQGWEIANSRVVPPLIAFIVVAILAFLAGQLPWFLFARKASMTAQLGGLGLFILAGGAFILVASQIRKLAWLEWMVWVYLALTTIHVFGQLIPGLKTITSRIIVQGTYTNSIFWVWLVALAVSQAFYNKRLHPYWRAALLVLTAATFLLLLGKDRSWTSGWLPAGVALGVILWINGSRLTWLVLGGGLVGLIWKLDKVQSLIMTGDNTYSLMTRVEAWRIIAEIVKVNPILGLGPANYYWYTPLYPILGYYVQFNSHNNYVDLIAQAGLLGLAMFLWFSAELGYIGWWLRTRVPEGFARAYVYGAIGGLAGTLVAGMFGDWFLPFIYNIGFRGFRASVLGWIFLGGLIAIEQMVRNGMLPMPAAQPEAEEGELDRPAELQPGTATD